MNILIVIHDFRAGGAEKVAVSLANTLSEFNNVSVVFLNDNGPFKYQLNESVEKINLNKNRLLDALPALITVFKQCEFDIIISHLTHINVASILASLVARKTKKLVVVEHSQMSLNYNKLDSKIMRGTYLSTKLLYNLPCRVVGVSNGVCEGIKNFTGLKSNLLKTIYNPVLDRNFVSKREHIHSHPYFETNVPVFVYVGRLIHSKRVDILLKSFSLVLKEFDCRLIIVGDGDERSKLETVTNNLSINNKVSFLGFVNDPLDIVSNSHCLVLTSEWEGLPTVLIEALSVGVQCVSTDCPSGPREILNNGDLGFLCRVNDSVDISKSMILSITNPKNIFDADLSRFEKKFVSKQYLECLL